MRKTRKLLGFVLATLTVGACGSAEDSAVLEAQDAIASTSAALTSSQSALQWANTWLHDVVATPAELAENVYTADSPSLVAMSTGVKAANRTVCGTLMTRLIQTTGLTSSNFYNSFPKSTTVTNCLVGSSGGTSSPDAAQYVHKIADCASTGVVKFSKRTTISQIVAGDILAVAYPERTDISGHVMMVRSAPQVDSGLLAGPDGSTGYAVEIIDSTSTQHGTSTTYPDSRPGAGGAANNQGFGTGTFVVYADASGAIVATRWSPTDSTRFSTSEHPVAVGGVQ